MNDRGSLFPEGLAGGRQGEVASYLRRGVGHKLKAPPGSNIKHRDEIPSPLLLMRRESSRAVMEALDAYASGEEWGEAPATRPRRENVDGESDTASDTSGSAEVGNPQEQLPNLNSKSKIYESEEERLGEVVPRRARRWRTLNMGKKWDKAQALAEAKRKPLKANRPARVRPQQV